jgi:hypothetical protein
MCFLEKYDLFSWKTNGEIVSIDCNLSDTRLIGLFQLIQSIPFPQSNQKTTKNKQVCLFIHLILYIN